MGRQMEGELSTTMMETGQNMRRNKGNQMENIYGFGTMVEGKKCNIGMENNMVGSESTTKKESFNHNM